MDSIAERFCFSYQQVKRDCEEVYRTYQGADSFGMLVSLDRATRPIPFVSIINSIALLVIQFLVYSNLAFSSDSKAKNYFFEVSRLETLQNILTLGLANAYRGLFSRPPRILVGEEEIIAYFCGFSELQEVVILQEAVNDALLRKTLQKRETLLLEGSKYCKLHQEFYKYWRKATEKPNSKLGTNQLQGEEKTRLVDLATSIQKKAEKGQCTKIEKAFLNSFLEEWFYLITDKEGLFFSSDVHALVKKEIDDFLQSFWKGFLSDIRTNFTLNDAEERSLIEKCRFEIKNLRGYLGIPITQVYSKEDNTAKIRSAFYHVDSPTPGDFDLASAFYFDVPLSEEKGDDLAQFLRKEGSLFLGNSKGSSRIFRIHAFLQENKPTIRCFFHSFHYLEEAESPEIGAYGGETEKLKMTFENHYHSSPPLVLENKLPFSVACGSDLSKISPSESKEITFEDLHFIQIHREFSQELPEETFFEEPLSQFPKKPFVLSTVCDEPRFSLSVERKSRFEEVTIFWVCDGTRFLLKMNAQQVLQAVHLLSKGFKMCSPCFEGLSSNELEAIDPEEKKQKLIEQETKLATFKAGLKNIAPHLTPPSAEDFLAGLSGTIQEMETPLQHS